MFAHYLKGQKLLELVLGVLYIREPIICVEKTSFILQFILVIFLCLHFIAFLMFHPHLLVFFWMYKPTPFSLHQSKQSKDKAFPEKYHVERSLLLLQHSAQAGVCK